MTWDTPMISCPICAKPRALVITDPTQQSKNEWLLVDLGVASDVSGVETQGRGEIDEWVSQFMVSYSLDAFKWEFARDIYGNKKVFRGNSDAHSVRHSYLEHPVCVTDIQGDSSERRRGFG